MDRSISEHVALQLRTCATSGFAGALVPRWCHDRTYNNVSYLVRKITGRAVAHSYIFSATYVSEPSDFRDV